MFRRVQLAALDDHEQLGSLDAEAGFDADRWGEALDAYYDEHDSIATDADARGPDMLTIEEGEHEWRLRQTFADPASDHDWGITASVDLVASAEHGEAIIRVLAVGTI